MILPVLQRSRAGEVCKHLSEMIFGGEACQSAYRCNRMICVFQLFYRYVYFYRVQELNRRLSELSLEKMIERRFADTAVFRQVGHRKFAVVVIRYILDSLLERLVKGDGARRHLRKDDLQKLVKERICLQYLKLTLGR